MRARTTRGSGYSKTCSVTVTATSTIPTSGLVREYLFSGNANDTSGYGYNGTVSGATLTTDRFGNTNKAYSFGAVTNRISAVDTSIPSGSSTRTFSFWFKSSSTATGVHLIHGTSAYAQEFAICSSSGGIWCDPYSAGFVDSPTALRDGQWHHIVITYNGSSGTLYIDSVARSTVTKALNTTLSGTLYIGGRDNNSFIGSIDNVRIYNRVLSATEIESLYNDSN